MSFKLSFLSQVNICRNNSNVHIEEQHSEQTISGTTTVHSSKFNVFLKAILILTNISRKKIT